MPLLPGQLLVVDETVQEGMSWVAWSWWDSPTSREIKRIMAMRKAGKEPPIIKF